MIQPSEYQKRRREVLNRIDDDSIVIIPSAKSCIRSNDTEYPFRQDNDFYYLTGFNEPDAVLILVKNHSEGEFILFNQEKDLNLEIWVGAKVGQENACQIYGADSAYPISQFKKKLPDFLINKQSIYFPIGKNRLFDHKLFKIIQSLAKQIRLGINTPTQFFDIRSLVHEMRLFKSPFEIQQIQKAIDITEKAHIAVMKACRPGMNEAELNALLQYFFLKEGGEGWSYYPIVGSGANSCTLHYNDNNQIIGEDDVVLIDAGAEFQNYAADITRTIPANGKFTKEQSAIYEIVLKAQTAAISAIKPGVPYTLMQEICVRVITEGLVDIGLLKGNINELIQQKSYFQFYMHNAGHWLGMDVHDVGKYRLSNQVRALAPKMVFTVEPGIYISDRLPVDKKWHNIGIRIEDNVCVTENGCEVLSHKIPKKIDEIEALMRN